jgi:hypothetical protein
MYHVASLFANSLSNFGLYRQKEFSFSLLFLLGHDVILFGELKGESLFSV